MELYKKTSAGKSNAVIKILIKILILSIVGFLLVVLIDKINFPYPNKKIEKVIPNETFKVVK
tara:strand:- start:307 stop:492 length:186 start_codon:yes stop_codon:yes gene_type:complete